MLLNPPNCLVGQLPGASAAAGEVVPPAGPLPVTGSNGGDTVKKKWQKNTESQREMKSSSKVDLSLLSLSLLLLLLVSDDGCFHWVGDCCHHYENSLLKTTDD